jgi:hypothetical protein
MYIFLLSVLVFRVLILFPVLIRCLSITTSAAVVVIITRTKDTVA